MFLWTIQNARLILYVPVCDEMYFNNAIPILFAVLMKTQAKINFMHYFLISKLALKNGKSKKNFLSLLKGIKFLDDTIHRKQDRTKAQNMTIYKIMTCIPWPWG